MNTKPFTSLFVLLFVFLLLFTFILLLLNKIKHNTQPKIVVQCDAIVNDLHTNDTLCIIHKKEINK